MPLIYLATEDDPAYLRLLAHIPWPGVQLTADAGRADIVLAAPPVVAPRLHEFTSLAWLQSTYAGVDALLKPGLREDFQLTNVRGVFGQQIAEYVLGLGLYHRRQFADYASQQSLQLWKPHPYQTMHGKQMMIFGTGSIGCHLARAAAALGMVPVGVNRSGKMPANSAFDSVHPMAEAPGLLQQADWVVCTLPSTPETEGIFNAMMFSNCREALFFNVGRGSCVNHADLLSALNAGQVDHAFLDVFVQEPLPASEPLWGHPMVTITPHIAAPSVPAQVVDVFMTNLEHYVSGRPLDFLVNRAAGY